MPFGTNVQMLKFRAAGLQACSLLMDALSGTEPGVAWVQVVHGLQLQMRPWWRFIVLAVLCSTSGTRRCPPGTRYLSRALSQAVLILMGTPRCTGSQCKRWQVDFESHWMATGFFLDTVEPQDGHDFFLDAAA